jgi:transposase-like protein
MDDLSRFVCVNSACGLHGKRNAGNLYVRDRYAEDDRRLLCCKVCGKRFSERRGTALFGSRLSAQTTLSVLEHLNEGCGIRQSARLTKVNRKTVGRLAEKAGAHAKAMHDELVAFSPADARSAVRREVGVRSKKAGALPSKRSG